MLKNITLSAEELIIQKAREKAKYEKKTINKLFREWLNKYVNSENTIDDFDHFMKKVSYVKPGKKFTRDEMNAR